MYQQHKEYGSVKTDSAGEYRFGGVKKGSYYVAFIYDTSTYSVTKYKQSGINEGENSDVIENEMLGEKCATTELINLTNQNVEGINAGFTTNTIFDLSLKKSVTKITVKNEEGTKEYSYNKGQLAKVEIAAKYLQNTTIDIEYLIEVTNEGEIPGYAGDIVDYKPNDLDFNKDSNSGWSTGKDGALHNTSLSNTLIAAGETKTLTLKLSKKLSSDGTGTKSNTAEIAAASNEYSATDRDSTPGNRNEKEDDMSKAEVIIGVKTGLVTITILVVSIALVILIPTAIIIFKKRRGGQDGIKEN